MRQNKDESIINIIMQYKPERKRSARERSSEKWLNVVEKKLKILGVQ